jgi:hypothetical protein
MSLSKRLTRLEHAIASAVDSGSRNEQQRVLEFIRGNHAARRTVNRLARERCVARAAGDIAKRQRADNELSEYLQRLVTKQFGQRVANTFFSGMEDSNV